MVKSQSKLIVCFVDNDERFRFFNRMDFESCEMLYLTTRLSIYFLLKRLNCRVFLLKRGERKVQLCGSEFKEDFEVFVGGLTSDAALNLYDSVLSYLSFLNRDNEIKCLFIWNGSGVAGHAFRDFSKENSVPKLFFELSNLPDSIFVDSEGVNAKSSLFVCKDNLFRFGVVENFDFDSWFLAYKEFKRNPIPQKKNKYKIDFMFLIDFMFWFFCGVKEFNVTHKLKSVFSRLKGRFGVKQLGEYVELDSDYVFLPLQVSTDTQLLINSDYDNEKMIEVALEEAVKLGARLLVKIHPAETDFQYLSIFKKAIDSKRILLASNNTLNLIENALLVVVNNSTVGLESLLYKKNVKVMGRALYSNFTHFDVDVYVGSYLINGIDYFSGEKICKSKLDEIIKRAVL